MGLSPESLLLLDADVDVADADVAAVDAAIDAEEESADPVDPDATLAID